ncbi:GxxExxY protein [Pontiellaceae bacterium B1224]|nr:GxxExxY protein [Pontiellaceae bacterium B1224]
MPVSVDAQLSELSQAEFSKVSYEVMAEIFALHRELGRLFDEIVYKNTLKSRMDNIETEVEIKVSFRDFHKSYFMDVLASSGAVLELKAVDTLHQRHRSQLLNYLLLTELKHGKLVNLRPEMVQHEFINATQTLEERQLFNIQDSGWHSSIGFESTEKSLLIELIRDWGTGLERSLYEEALIHLIADQNLINNEVDVLLNGNVVATQPVLLCSPSTALKLTTFENNTDIYRKDLCQFLAKTPLKTIQWINISRGLIALETITK